MYLEVSGIAKSFGRKNVLTNASIAVPRSNLIGIVGENGAGKSTLLKIIVGAEPPDRGNITRRGRVGYCPQQVTVFDELTVRENFRLFGAAHGLLDSDESQEQANGLMEKLFFRKFEHSVARHLSGGTRQKLNLAIALLNDPDVLVLDEPYAAFDWQTYLQFWDIAGELRASGNSVLIVSHFLYDKHKFDQIYELRAGALERIS